MIFPSPLGVISAICNVPLLPVLLLRCWTTINDKADSIIFGMPIGGFVKLYGEDEADVSKIKKEKSRAFFAKKPWKRTIVLIAGVAMNFLLAWFIISFLFTQGVMVQGDAVYIEEIAENSPAEQAGLKENDVVTTLIGSDGVEYEIETPTGLVDATNQYRGKEIVLLIVRNGEKMEVQVLPRGEAPKGEGA